MLYPIASIQVLLGKVSAWDKTAAIVAVVGTTIVCLSAIGWIYVKIRSWWPDWRSKRAASLCADGFAFVGTQHHEALVVRVTRDVFCHAPGLSLRDNAAKQAYEIPGVRWWSDKWLDMEDNPCEFPKQLRRGDELRTTLHVMGQRPWKGLLCIEAFAEGRCMFQVRTAFEIHAS